MWLATATPTVAAPAVGQHVASSPGLGGAMFALLAVLALIVGLAWLLKRLPATGLRGNDQLRIVTSLTVGQRERVVVVQVGEQQLLLGVTAQSITTLHQLPEALAIPAPQPFTASPFAQLLAGKLRKDSRNASTPH